MENYSVIIYTKSYSKHFLELNYGNPVNLSKCKELYEIFKSYLKKHSNSKSSKVLSNNIYSHKVEIFISEDDFYRFGWEISSNDMFQFNKIIQNRAKFMMRNLISFYNSFMSLSDSIRYFQDNFGFNEDVWPFESIKKDLMRNNNLIKIDFKKEITEKIEKIILNNLYEYGTISDLIYKKPCKQ